MSLLMGYMSMCMRRKIRQMHCTRICVALVRACACTCVYVRTLTCIHLHRHTRACTCVHICIYAYCSITGVGICVSTAYVNECLYKYLYTCRLHCTRICVAFVCAYAHTRVYLHVCVSSLIAVNTCIRHRACMCVYA